MNYYLIRETYTETNDSFVRVVLDPLDRILAEEISQLDILIKDEDADYLSRVADDLNNFYDTRRRIKREERERISRWADWEYEASIDADVEDAYYFGGTV